MTTFKQYLTEKAFDLDPVVEKHVVVWAKQIARDCQPAIKTFIHQGRYSLFRGLRGEQNTVHEAANQSLQPRQVRMDRSPLDTTPSVHFAMDKWFEQNFGVKYRSQAISCTSDWHTAQEYGTPHLIFPIGRFRYIWTPNEADIGAGVDEQVLDKLRSPSTTSNPRQTLQQLEQQSKINAIVSNIMEGMTFWESKANEAIEHEHEIMVRTDQYYAINMPRSYVKRFTDMIRGEL